MKYLLLLVFISCSRSPVKVVEEKKQNVYIPRSERIKQCVHEMLIKDVKAIDALKICDRIYRGEL